MTAFIDLGLAEPIARALADERYETPTPIQAQTIPQVLAARDVVGIAQTGTGKTAAFALPILQHLSKDRRRPERKSCRVLVLSPTRELSAQIVDSFVTYGRYVRPSVTLAIGGVPINRQMRALQNGVDVLVATPGRLLDLMDHRAILLDRIEVFVLDEADRMLDMGFINDIRRVVARLPKERQTLFFSATMPREIEELAAKMLRDPVRVAVTPEATTAEKIDQRIIHVDRAAKGSLLAEVLRDEAVDRALVFTRTKHGADKVVRTLAKANISAAAIHGNKSQNQRERVLADFRAGKIRTLIATDIAARGIDVDGISHVINYDLPNIPESYVHRIGRTARAGAEGVAISFCDGEERAFLRDIEKLIRMAIPATDRRGQKTGEPESLDAQPQEQRNARPNGHHRAGRPQQGKPHQDRPHRGKPHQGKPHQGKPHEGRSHEGKSQHGKSQQHGRPQQGEEQRGQHGQRSRPQNGKPHNGQAGRQDRNQERHQDRRQERGQEARPGNDGSIATVAFMRPKQHHRGQGGRPPR